MFQKALFALLILFTISFASVSKEGIEFKPVKKSFNKSEDVCFVLKNNSDQLIYLPSSAPWVVFEDKNFENVVFSPVATQSIVQIKPSQTKKWCWKQKDFNDEQVPSGEYTIRLTIFKGGERIFLSSIVKINNSR